MRFSPTDLYHHCLRKIKQVIDYLQFSILGLEKNKVKQREAWIAKELNKAKAVTKGQRPLAAVVIGGAGSGKSKISDILKKDLGPVVFDSQQLKDNLGQHEHQAIVGAIAHRKNIIFEVVGGLAQGIQTTLDALKQAGYDIELHWVDAKEATVVERIRTRNKVSRTKTSLLYAKSSNKASKQAYQELLKMNPNGVSFHRWSNNDTLPQRNDQQDIEKYFHTFIAGLQVQRLALFESINHLDKKLPHLKQHLGKLNAFVSLENKNPHEMLLFLINDISLFPEIYIPYQKELLGLYELADKNNFHVYFTSIKMRGPVKTHGGISIGSATLQKGVSLAAAGDQKRGKLILPGQFREKLLKRLKAANDKNDAWPACLKERFGTTQQVIDKLRQADRVFDTYCLNLLVTHICPDLHSEYLKIQYNVNAYNKIFELWSKPRTSMQKRDGLAFNVQYPTYLKEQTHASIIRGFGHLHHGITRNTAIREQKHVSVSTVMQRWLRLEAHKQDIDLRRKLEYKADPNAWHFEFTAVSNQMGNCNSIATYLLGAAPRVASLFNVGTAPGLKIKVARTLDKENVPFTPVKQPQSFPFFSDTLKSARQERYVNEAKAKAFEDVQPDFK